MTARGRRTSRSLEDCLLERSPKFWGMIARARPWMRHAGTLASGDRDASRTVNAVVYGRPRP